MTAELECNFSLLGEIGQTTDSSAGHSGVRAREAKYTLAIGALGPIDDPSSQAARLLNLGYWYGDDDDLGNADALALAAELFQKDEGLTVTGKTDADFVKKLSSVHDGK